MDATTKGLFNLDVFKESTEDDLTKAPIGESGSGSEFQSNDPAINPTKDQPSAGADGKVSIPGGEKENPTAKPVEGSNPSIPGGDGEKPSAKPADGTNPSIPAQATLTTAEWSSMMSALKNSFKEGVQIMEFLENANIVEDVEMTEEEYLENVAFGTIFDYYDNGGFYEAIDAENKQDAKAAIKKIRSKMSKHGFGQKYGLRQYWSLPEKMAVNFAGNLGGTMRTAAVASTAIAGVGAFVSAILGSALTTAINTPIQRWWIKLFRTNHSFTARWWQMVGGFNAGDDISEKKLKEIVDEMREDYKEELGDFTFNVIRIAIPTKLLRLLVTSTTKGYILVIDQKEKGIETINIDPSDKDVKELESLVGDGSKKKDKKEEPSDDKSVKGKAKTESADADDDDDDKGAKKEDPKKDDPKKDDDNKE